MRGQHLNCYTINYTLGLVCSISIIGCCSDVYRSLPVQRWSANTILYSTETFKGGVTAINVAEVKNLWHVFQQISAKQVSIRLP